MSREVRIVVCVLGIGGCFTEDPITDTTNASASTTDPDPSTAGDSDGTTAVDSTGGEAVCGDGMVQGDEQCDDGNTEPGDGCHSDCTDYRLVFVSVTPTSGALDGLSGADQRCQDDASAAGHEGTFMAWLSVDGTSAAERMQPADVPYRRADGIMVAEHWDDLVDGMLAAQLDVGPGGGPLDGGTIWTGTSADGQFMGPACSGWTSNALDQMGHGGATAFADGQWTALGTQPCSAMARLYCVQQ